MREQQDQIGTVGRVGEKERKLKKIEENVNKKR